MFRRGWSRLAFLLIVASLIASATGVLVSWATSNPSDASVCTSVAGTAKTAVKANLDAATPMSASVSLTLTASGCAAPRVDARATNGPVTQASIVGKLTSPTARCVLSTSTDVLWGKLTVKWKNAAGEQILDSASKKVTDLLYVRLDPDGTERYDFHGFDAKGPGGGGDASAEIGFNRVLPCGAAPTQWSVISDGIVSTTGETVGSDGSDDLRIETPRASATTTTTTEAPTTTTEPPTTTTTTTTGPGCQIDDGDPFTIDTYDYVTEACSHQFINLPPWAPNNGMGSYHEADFCVVEFPTSTSTPAGVASETIYGKTVHTGLGALPGGQAGAQLGYGPAGSDPKWNPDWTWVDANFTVQVGDSEQYAATIAPVAAGAYSYAYRFSFDGTYTATYCDLDGAGKNPGLGFDSGQLGQLTVTP